jgi:hypothetical protein
MTRYSYAAPNNDFNLIKRFTVDSSQPAKPARPFPPFGEVSQRGHEYSFDDLSERIDPTFQPDSEGDSEEDSVASEEDSDGELIDLADELDALDDENRDDEFDSAAYELFIAEDNKRIAAAKEKKEMEKNKKKDSSSNV